MARARLRRDGTDGMCATAATGRRGAPGSAIGDRKWLNRAVPTSQPAARRSLHLAAVGIGGAAGTLARAALGEWLPAGEDWPWPTFLANAIGTALLAVLVLRAPRLMHPSGTWRSLLGVGLCGGLTTFALFQLELARFLKDGRFLLALAYGAASLAVGLAVAFAVRPAERAA